MDHALQFASIALGLIKLVLGLIGVAHPLVQLGVHAIAPLNQCLPLFVQDSYPGVLGKAFLFPLREGAVVLVDGALLPLSQFLVFSD